VAGPVSRTWCGSATHIVWFRNLEDLYGAYSSVRTLDMDEELHHPRAGAGAGACVRALAAVERPVGAAVSDDPEGLLVFVRQGDEADSASLAGHRMESLSREMSVITPAVATSTV
jgi:hypothetical protein